MLHELRDQVLMDSCAVAHGRAEACMLPADRPGAHPGPPRQVLETNYGIIRFPFVLFVLGNGFFPILSLLNILYSNKRIGIPDTISPFVSLSII